MLELFLNLMTSVASMVPFWDCRGGRLEKGLSKQDIQASFRHPHPRNTHSKVPKRLISISCWCYIHIE